MDILAILALGAGILGLLHFVTIPRFRRRFALQTGRDKVTTGKYLAVLDVLKMVSALAVLSSVAALVVAGSFSFYGGSSATEVGASLARLRAWKETIDGLNTWFAYAAVALLVFGLWRLAAAKGEQHTAEALTRSIGLERERVRAELDSGTAPELPLTDEMIEIDGLLEQRHAWLEQIEVLLAAGQTQTEAGEDLAALKKKFAEELTILTINRRALDEARRMQINWNPPELDPPPPETRREKIAAVFFSRGLLNSMQGTARWGFIAGAVLLVPSLLAVNAADLVARAEARDVSLTSLYVSLRKDEAQKSWDEAAGKGSAAAQKATDRELAQEDEEALDRLAYAYEAGVASNLARLAGRTQTAAVGSELSSYRARKAILSNFAANADPASAAARVLAADGHVPMHDDLLTTHHAPGEKLRPTTPEGKAFRKRLRDEVALASGDQWQRFKRSATEGFAAFQRPATAAQMEGALISRLTGVVGGEGAGVAADSARGAVATNGVSSETRTRAFDTRSREFMADIARGGNLEHAADLAGQRASTGAFTAREEAAIRDLATRVPKMEDVSRHIQLAPPSLVRTEIAALDVNGMRSASQKILSAQYGAARAAELSLDALHDFNHYFPGQSPDVGGGAGKSGKTATHAEFRQSRSFTALRGSRRIGGVLIGREPDGDKKALDFIEVRWSIKGSQTSLEFKRADNAWIALGPYRTSVLYQALAYAADARPITVTMTTASPLAELRVNLHPALVDSPLGCHATEIDRFVDVTTGRDKATALLRQDAAELVAGQRALYQLAWAHMVTDQPGRSWIAAKHPEIAATLGKRANEELKGLRGVPAANFSRALARPEAAVDKVQGILAAKPEFFNPLVVRVVAACLASSSGQLDRFDNCARSSAKVLANRDMDANPAWDAPPPKLEQWSGVREAGFSLDADLRFATLHAPAGAGELWPFDFIVQYAFGSPAFGASKKLKWYEDDDTVRAYEDKQPWEVAALSAPLRQAISQGVRASGGEWGTTLANLREFAVLQRLFRASLTGKLGERFPVDRLAALAAEAAKQKSAVQRTMRWNPRPGLIEARLVSTMISEAKVDGPRAWSPAVAAQIAGCARRYPPTMGRALALVRDEEWDAACRLSSVSVPEPGRDGERTSLSPEQEIALMSVVTSETRKLRVAMKVADDDAKVGMRCMSP